MTTQDRELRRIRYYPDVAQIRLLCPFQTTAGMSDGRLRTR